MSDQNPPVPGIPRTGCLRRRLHVPVHTKDELCTAIGEWRFERGSGQVGRGYLKGREPREERGTLDVGGARE